MSYDCCFCSDSIDKSVGPFEFTMELCDNLRGRRTIEVVSSGVLWYDLKEKLAQSFNVHPSAIQLRYRLSTDHPKSLPFELTSMHHLLNLIKLLRPLIVPPILASGRPSTRKMKPVTVQVFMEGDDAKVVTSDGKVNSRSCKSNLILIIQYRKAEGQRKHQL